MIYRWKDIHICNRISPKWKSYLGLFTIYINFGEYTHYFKKMLISSKMLTSARNTGVMGKNDNSGKLSYDIVHSC